MISMTIKKMIFLSAIFSMVFLSGSIQYVYGEEMNGSGMEIQTNTKEQGAKEMKMEQQTHDVAVKQVRTIYLATIKKAQDEYAKALLTAKKEKSKKKELVAKQIFLKAKSDAMKKYQKDRNAAMKATMKKKK